VIHHVQESNDTMVPSQPDFDVMDQNNMSNSKAAQDTKSRCRRFLNALKNPEVVAGLFVGCFTGFLSGAFGTGSPPLMIYLNFISLSKQQMRALPQLVALIMCPWKVYVLLDYNVFHASHWPLYLVAPILSYLGTFIGDKVHKKVSVQHIYFLMQVLMVMSAFTLASPGTTTIFGILMLCWALLLFTGGFVYSFWFYFYVYSTSMIPC